MAATTTTSTVRDTEFLLNAARDAFSGLRRSEKSDRTAAVHAFLEAVTDEDREVVVEQYGAWLVRKGLRVAALSTKDEEVANVFWALRDSVDPDGFVFPADEDEEAVVEREVEKFNAALSTAA